MVYSRRGSRSSETVFVRAPANRLGGRAPRVLAVRWATKVSGRCRGSRTAQVDPPPDFAEKNNNMTIRRIYSNVQLTRGVLIMLR